MHPLLYQSYRILCSNKSEHRFECWWLTRYTSNVFIAQSLEDLKQEFEETLVERAGEVSHTLERIQQFVTELEELSDVAHVNKYIRVCGFPFTIVVACFS